MSQNTHPRLTSQCRLYGSKRGCGEHLRYDRKWDKPDLGPATFTFDFGAEPSLCGLKGDRTMIDPQTAHEGAALIATAIGELMENGSADAFRLGEGDLKVMVIKADRLKAIGADVVALADALAILAQRSAKE